MDLTQKKLNEAKIHLFDAEKSMKTSLFKRKADFDSAANSYSSAGSCFKIAKDYNKAIECYLKSSECYYNNNSLFNSAKQHEQIGYIANEIKNYELLYESFQKAAEFLIISGSRDSATILLEKGANILKINEPVKSLNLYKRALNIAEIEEKHHEMINFYENAINLAIRISNSHEAIDLIDKLFLVLMKYGANEQINKYLTTAVLIYLEKDDWISAQNYLDKISSIYASSFSKVKELIQIYDEKDDEKFKDLIKNHLNYVIDNEALKIAKKIIKSDLWLKSFEQNKLQIDSVQKQNIDLNISSNEQATKCDEDFFDDLK